MLQTIPVSAEDAPFLFQVYAGTRQEEVAAWGWDAAQQEAFLRMQFEMQRRAYALQYPDADHRIILCQGCQAGRIMVLRTAQEILLVDIAFLPDFRNTGLGSSLIRELQAEATRVDKPLRLRVLRASPARRLYERLGFVCTGENGMHDAMEWRPEQEGRPPINHA